MIILNYRMLGINMREENFNFIILENQPIEFN